MFSNKWKHRNVYVAAFLTTCIICLILYSLKNEEQQSLVIIDNTSQEPDNIFNASRLFNIHFQYVLNAEPCDNSTSIIITVTSYFGDVETRSAMRRSFSSEKLNKLHLKRVFLLGITSDNKYTTQNSVTDESKRFKDIVQGNFQESYRNLTFKHVMGHKWVTEHCSAVKYVIKMDDDIVINMYKLLPMFNELKLPSENVLAGYVLKNMKVIREPANKWYVTHEEYEKPFYPPFLSGWFYITTPEISRKIVNLSFSIPYFWIDDVYITGEIAAKLNLKHVNLNKYFAVHSEFLQCCIADVRKRDLDCEFIVGPNGGDNNLFFTFNKAFEKCFQYECKKRITPINKTCIVQKQEEVGEGKALISDFHLF